MRHIYDMIIIGGGPAGYTAALYASRAKLDVVVIERMSAGGQMSLTGNIDNYPGNFGRHNLRQKKTGSPVVWESGFF